MAIAGRTGLLFEGRKIDFDSPTNFRHFRRPAVSYTRRTRRRHRFGGQTPQSRRNRIVVRTPRRGFGGVRVHLRERFCGGRRCCPPSLSQAAWQPDHDPRPTDRLSLPRRAQHRAQRPAHRKARNHQETTPSLKRVNNARLEFVKARQQLLQALAAK